MASILEALMDIYKPPFQLLENTLQRTYSFCMHHFPKEIQSSDDPPMKVGKRTDVIPIDECLGFYSPEKQEITIFQKGIKDVSELLGVNHKHLEIVVKIHEWAHAFFHLSVKETERIEILKDDSNWADVFETSTELFRDVDFELHEVLTQILTFYCIQDMLQSSKTDRGKRTVEEIERTFNHLSSHQPYEYRIHDLLDIPRDRILKSFDLLKNRLLVGKLKPWKTIITW